MNKKEGRCRAFVPTPPMVVNEITRLFQARMRRQDPEGVLSQDSARLIMRSLAHKDGKSQLDLVRETHLKPPTVSVTLRRLEEEGMVLRESDPIDQRVTRVYLSARGVEHVEKIRERLRALETELMQGFSEEEAACLLQFLERMRDNILPAEKRNDSTAEANEKITK